ncbi:hypothetical protein BDV93DRAFT_513944 [Ceratobasidium sp. AG-I]|nr:hypothetical protein BDV93DRAFT_513944 [Ceratobasidium sp. AG-I]
MLDNEIRGCLPVYTPAESPYTQQSGVFVHCRDTHVLLAASPKDQPAREITVTYPRSGQKTRMGLFTFHLLQAFRTCHHSTTSYLGLMRHVAQRMINYATQHPGEAISQLPQCKGANHDRLPFQTKFALTKGMLRVFPGSVRGEHLVKAGNATGVMAGTVFDVYPANMPPGSGPVTQLVARRVRSTEAILSAKEPGQTVEIPSEAYVKVSRSNDYSHEVRILIVDRPRFDPVWGEVFSEIKSLPIHLIWTEPHETSDLVLAPTETGALLQSQPELPFAQAATKLLMTEEGFETLTETLTDILVGIIRFHFHLHRQNTDRPLRDQIGMQLFELEVSSHSSPSEVPIYGPKAGAEDLFKESLATGSTVKLREDPEKEYGLMLTNNTVIDLFPYVLYYNLQDYSITSLYSSPSNNTSAPLPAIFRGVPDSPGLGGMSIGYGYNGKPMHMRVADGYTQALGFFVLVVSTKWTDFARITQSSVLEETRGDGVQDSLPVSDVELWDTVTISVLLSK